MKANIVILPIELYHVDLLRGLLAHHKDPFDRMLIAQAMAEDMTLVSKDRHFEAYPVRVLW